MIRTFLSITLITFCTSLSAQNQEETFPGTSSDRKALLKDFVTQDRGEITSMEASAGDDGGVITGYSSGAVLRCDSSQACMEFSGTPNVPVQQIAVSKQGASEIVWVTYRQGALYQCVNKSCNKLVR